MFRDDGPAIHTSHFMTTFAATCFTHAVDARRRPGVAVPRAAIVMLVLLAALVLTGCKRQPKYSQETPDDVLKSAAAMIKNGDADKLPSLIYADSDQMRLTLNQIGRLMGQMQKLAEAVQSRFPDELAKMKADAGAEGNKLLEDLMAGRGPGSSGGSGDNPRRRGRDRNPQDDQKTRDQFRGLFNSLFADPYGWLDANAARLSAETVSDDLAMIQLDGKPLFGGFTLPMQKQDGKWYVALPTNMPPLSQALPRTQTQWKILRSIIQVLDKTVKDMTEDTRTGRVSELDALARNAQEKVMFPAMIAFAAYAKELSVVSDTDDVVKEFKERQKSWVASRTKAAGADPEKADDRKQTVSPLLLSVLNQLAPSEIEKKVRKDDKWSIAKMDEAEFEALIGAWLKNAEVGGSAGLKIDTDLSPAAVDAKLEAWKKQRETQAAKDAAEPPRKK